jgi:hypothetical protein
MMIKNSGVAKLCWIDFERNGFKAWAYPRGFLIVVYESFERKVIVIDLKGEMYPWRIRLCSGNNETIRTRNRQENSMCESIRMCDNKEYSVKHNLWEEISKAGNEQ